tara:strand:- start:104 stop:391 length:288 start_codon:yes stop_codon:yes gene_type:complete
MLPTLSYPYVGSRFPELSGKTVIVKAMAELADIPYVLLKNRMGMKKKRSTGLATVIITDKDLLPRRREKPKQKKSNRWKQDDANRLSSEWLRRKI